MKAWNMQDGQRIHRFGFFAEWWEPQWNVGYGNRTRLYDLPKVHDHKVSAD
jgi:hypothetical protein